MQTRRDHVQAHQYAMGRLATALVSGDPGRGDSPTKRSALGTFFGVGVVVLLCTGFGMYGLVSPAPKNDWRTPGSIIVEQQTGTRYLYLGGQLHPVLNYASAVLLTGRRAAVPSVSAKSLGSTPHGAPVGIVGAPDSLPSPATLVSGPWTECLRPDLAAGQVLDLAPEQTSQLPSDRQLLVTGQDGQRYLLWRGVKYPVPDAATLIALGLDGDRALSAPENWLAAVPTGIPLTAAGIADSGSAAGQVAGHPVRVGQVFQTSTGGSEHNYVMTSAGIAPASATESALLAALPGAPAVLRVTSTDIAAVPVSADQTLTSALPDVLGARTLDTAGQAVCLRQESDGTKLDSRLVLEAGPAATGNRPVLVPPNGGVIAVEQEQLAQQNPAPRRCLITDQGICYPLGDSGAQATLGLAGEAETALPESVLGLLARGPVLDRTAAAHIVRGG